MNKDEFLSELGKHLTILEDGELRDIMEEYTQHIDMKISKGLSEEEAIQDFGSVEELTGRILEAYHVKPEIQQAKHEKKLPDLSKAARETKKVYGSFLRGCGKFFCAAGNFLKLCWRKFKSGAGKVFHILALPFRKLGKWIKNKNKESPDIMDNENIPTEKMDTEVHKLKRGIGGAFTFAGHFAAGCFTMLFCFSRWCLRWFWNAAVFMASVITGFAFLVALFLFAMLLVWVLQGYPVTGMTLACLGIVMCTSSLTFLLSTFLLLKRKKNRNEPEQSKTVKEACYE